MLCRLKISNIAVIDNTEISFESGLNVLTGETGAGKSLIIDSLNLILGGRGSRDLIRSGEKKASVEASFFLPGSDLAEDGMIVIKREIYTDGRNMCAINGNMVTTSQLREFGEGLCDIHGQHENQSVMRQGSHIHFLDKYAGNDDELQSVGNLYEKRKSLSDEIKRLRDISGESLKKLDMLTFWADEIEKANLKPGEEEELLQAKTIMKNAEKIKNAVFKAHSLLYGGEVSARDLLSMTASELDSVSAYDENLKPAISEIYDALYKTEEAAEELLSYGDTLSFESQELEDTEDRLNLIHKLKSKYGSTIEEIIRYGENSRREAELIETSGDKLSELERELEKTEASLKAASGLLSEKRKKVSEEIENRVMEELSQLDMSKVVFKISITPTDFTPIGCDKVEFLISTNPSEPPKPLVKIASGGEISRICLALKTVLAKADTVPTLVFDEIDAGISGRASLKTGNKLRLLAQDRQILCITHLPQIAACAHNHYYIDKVMEGGSFKTTVKLLDYNGRIHELARIISGDNITESTLKAAKEMIPVN